MPIIDYLKEMVESDIISSPPMSEKECRAKIAEYSGRSLWLGWFLSQEKKNKIYIVKDIKKDSDLRVAMLCLFYYVSGSTLSYDIFLETPITLYRGISSKSKNYTAYEFDSYTTRKSLAQNFAHDGQIIEKIVKPKDTFGCVHFVGVGGQEIEVLVPIEKELSDTNYSDMINDIFTSDFNVFWDRKGIYDKYESILDTLNSPKEEYEYFQNVIIPHYNNYRNGIDEAFYGGEEFSIGRGETVYAEIFKNPSPSEIRSIFKDSKFGVRLGVVDTDLYAWNGAVLHESMQQRLGIGRFGVRFIYEKLSSTDVLRAVQRGSDIILWDKPEYKFIVVNLLQRAIPQLQTVTDELTDEVVWSKNDTYSEEQARDIVNSYTRPLSTKDPIIDELRLIYDTKADDKWTQMLQVIRKNFNYGGK